MGLKNIRENTQISPNDIYQRYLLIQIMFPAYFIILGQTNTSNHYNSSLTIETNLYTNKICFIRNLNNKYISAQEISFINTIIK